MDKEYHEEFFYRINPLIVIRPWKGDEFYNTENDKRRALVLVDWKKDRVLFVWWGQYNTNVFKITQQDAMTYLSRGSNQ